MDPCSDQRRDGTKDFLWGTEMDQLKAKWKTEQYKEPQMDHMIESMKDALKAR